MDCKTWKPLAEKYFRPLCTNEFLPDSDTSSCSICLTPIVEDGTRAVDEETCRTWSQPDGDHIRGLCTNQLFAEGNANNCWLCITPLDMRVSGCGCTAPKKLRAIHFLTVSYIGTPPTGAACVVNAPIGNFVLYGTCGAKTKEDQITVNTLAPVGTPTCTGYAPAIPEGSRTKKYSMTLVGSPYTALDGKRYQNITLTYSQRGAVWVGPSPPTYNQNFSYVWDGAIPWCDDQIGSGTLLQRGTTENPAYPGLFPPSVRAIISTEVP